MAAIHPDLRRRDILDRYVGAPLISIVGIGLLIVVVVLFREVRGRLTAPAAAILGLITAVALLVLYAAVVAWKRRRWYERLTALLERVPVQTRAWFWPGPYASIMARLECGIATHLIRPRFDLQALNGTVVAAHVDPGRDGPVVLETPSGVLWPVGGRTEIPPPPDLHRAVELLRTAGLTSQADALHGVLTAAYTTGSEMIGEIGLAIRRLQRAGVPAEVNAIFDQWLRDFANTL